MQMFSTKKLSDWLAYPFKQEKAGNKILIGSALILAGFVIPFIPMIFVAGYLAKISKRITAGDGKLELPEWDDWGELFKSGLRLFGVGLIYSLPMLIVFTIGFFAYFGSFVPLMIDDSSMGAPILMMLGMGVMFFTIAIGMLLSLIEGIILPAVLMHVIHHDQFSKGFDFKGWWSIFRKNLWGFMVAFILMFGLYYLYYMLVVVVAYSFVLAIAVPFLSAFASFYLGLLFMPLMAQAYYEGSDHLVTKEEEL